MITLVTSGTDYQITPSDLDELSRAAREMPIRELVMLGGSPGLEQWAKRRRIPCRIMRNLPEIMRTVDSAIVFPGRFTSGILRFLRTDSSIEIWDWTGTTPERKAEILADPTAAAHYDLIVEGEILPEGYGQDMRGRVQEDA